MSRPQHLTLRYSWLVHGTDDHGHASTVTVGVTTSGLIAMQTSGGRRVLLDERAVAAVMSHLRDAVGNAVGGVL